MSVIHYSSRLGRLTTSAVYSHFLSSLVFVKFFWFCNFSAGAIFIRKIALHDTARLLARVTNLKLGLIVVLCDSLCLFMVKFNRHKFLWIFAILG